MQLVGRGERVESLLEHEATWNVMAPVLMNNYENYRRDRKDA